MKQTVEWHFTHLDVKVTVTHIIVILYELVCQLFSRSNSHPIHSMTSESYLITSLVSSVYVSLRKCQYTFSIQIDANLTSSMYYNVSTSTYELMKQMYIRTSVFVTFETIQYSTQIGRRRVLSKHFYKTRMHSRRMHTTRSLTTCHMGVCVAGAPCHAHTHATNAASLWTEWRTHVKTYFVWRL